MRILITITLMMICLTAKGQTFIDTESKYIRSDVKGVIIQNSFPKGGLKYTDHNGKVYVYAVFWTRIINETDNPFTLTIDFPADSLELASSAGRYFKLVLPSDTMTLEKEKLFNYGLPVLESFLDKYLQKPTSLKRTINQKESSVFYVVTLFNKGVDGTLRTGLRLNAQNLFYRINDKEIHCGKIKFKN
ncbi:MAG: hypothetical protein ACK5FG_07270 [Chryseotalea sp.]|jgi:hypothetical protein|nr:hypothetical protein [Cytophagales bacterium]